MLVSPASPLAPQPILPPLGLLLVPYFFPQPATLLPRLRLGGFELRSHEMVVPAVGIRVAVAYQREIEVVTVGDEEVGEQAVVSIARLGAVEFDGDLPLIQSAARIGVGLAG